MNITSIFLHKASSYNCCRQAQPIEFLMDNFLAAFDMKTLFAHTIMLLLIDLALFQHYIVLTVLYCSTAESV